MKRTAVVTLLGIVAVMFFAPAGRVHAGENESAVYVIKKGDTLYGLSDRFMKDPSYWPSLWELNKNITNPHIIEPGQKVKLNSDRPAVSAAEQPKSEAATAAAKTDGKVEIQPVDNAAERLFVVNGSEGFLLENGLKPSGIIISTHQNRAIVGEDDIVYADIGRNHGAKPGDRFDIFKKMGAISHPVTNFNLGYKVIPLGTLQLSEVEEKVSKAIITKSYIEISAGSFLLPHSDRRREVALKASSLERSGYIVDTHTGNNAIASGDIAFIDLGKNQGVEVGNMLYVVRKVEADQKYVYIPVGKMPEELVGAVVVVNTGDNISTVLVIKSIDTIYIGDRVELKKSK